MTSKRKRIAIVVQRYGEEVNGGAELHARWLAEHLLTLAEVHVITTCAVDYQTWHNHYPAGDSELNVITVHRFAIDTPRRWQPFQALTRHLILNDHTLTDELAWMRQQGPFSTDLFNYIEAHQSHFDYFIFFTYAYATTYYGLPLVPHKAILVPTAHDEPYLYFAIYRALFHLPRMIIYNTQTEREIVQRVTRNNHCPSIVAGIGINTPPAVNPQQVRHKYGIEGDFILYVGRLDPAKNVPELINYFVRWQQDSQQPIKLVLAGKVGIEVPAHPHIMSLGFISEQDKFDLIAATQLMIIPSLYESLSMIALEAWLMETPVLANGLCQVLKDQCRQSHGGLYYTSYDEFIHCLQTLLSQKKLSQTLGKNGRSFTQKNYHWDVILAKYRAVFSLL